MQAQKKLLREKASLLRLSTSTWDHDQGDHGKELLRDLFFSRYQLDTPQVISGYKARATELDPTLLLEALHELGHQIVLPVVREKDQPLSFRLWTPHTPLRAGAFGIPVPPQDAPEIEPDILLVPLLAYDAKGHRLGYGGGFYDRTLEALRARKTIKAIGLAYKTQEFPEIPSTDRDQILDDVVAIEVGSFCKGQETQCIVF